MGNNSEIGFNVGRWTWAYQIVRDMPAVILDSAIILIYRIVIDALAVKMLYVDVCGIESAYIILPDLRITHRLAVMPPF